MANGKRIVAVHGYEHAVALCQGDHPDHDKLNQPDKWHMWQKDGILYVVNWGHDKDPEIAQLQELAEIECSQYE